MEMAILGMAEGAPRKRHSQHQLSQRILRARVQSSRHYPRVDDKRFTKRICEARGIPVPETYAVIERHGDIAKLPDLVRDKLEFVVKPGRGSEGRGIIVVTRHDGAGFTTADGSRLSPADMGYHVSTVLSGLYSLAGQPDCAIVEQRIVRHEAFGSSRHRRNAGYPRHSLSLRADHGHGAAADAAVARPRQPPPRGDRRRGPPARRLHLRRRLPEPCGFRPSGYWSVDRGPLDSLLAAPVGGGHESRRGFGNGLPGRRFRPRRGAGTRGVGGKRAARGWQFRSPTGVGSFRG